MWDDPLISKEEGIWFVRAKDNTSKRLMSLIIRTRKGVYEKHTFLEEELLAVKVDSVDHWTWVKNPEKTRLSGNIMRFCSRQGFIFLKRRKATKEELIGIKLSANAYEGGRSG